MSFSLQSAPPVLLETLKGYPALTVGLPIFTFALLVLDLGSGHYLAHKFSLYPGAVFELDLNRLSFYLLFHTSIVHWLVNIVSLTPLLCLYERRHGTIHTGVTLNLVAVVTGLLYSLVGSVVCPNTHVIGLSGVVFSFIAYVAYKERHTTPNIYRFQHAAVMSGTEIQIPILAAPFLYLIVTTIVFPASSVWGHFCSILAGFLFGLELLKFMFPPLKAVIYIEGKVEPLIALINRLVTFVRETDAIHQRSSVYVPIFSTDAEAA